MLVSLLVKMLYILVLCRVLLIAGVQTLTIDSQLGTSVEDCFERISIGERLPNDAIYRNVSELTNRECEQICKQDKQCQAYDYGVGAKGNATCNLSTLDEKTIKEQNPLKRHSDYDVYIRRFQCEQSPPTPIQPLSDDPGSGPQHRPVFRPEIDERPSLAEDYLISADLGYGKPPESSYRPDDVSNNKPDYDVGPSYGDHKPQDIPYKPSRPHNPYRPNRPNDPYRPDRPNDPYRPEKPNDPYRPERPQNPQYGPDRPYDQPYGSDRPQDPYKPHEPQRPSRPEPNDVLQFQGISKPRPPVDEYNRPDPYRPEIPDYHYIIRPNRKPRPQDVYANPLKPDPYNDGHPSGPIGPPNRPYRPTRPYDKPLYSYDGQYASNYGQNSQNDNSLYVEIHDPPRPYIPIKDRPNQQYNGQGYLGYGTYSSQNSYSQSQNSQYTGTITELGGYDHNDTPQKPGYKPPAYNERPQKPVYETSNDNGYGSQRPQRPNDFEKPSYGNQGSYGSQQGGYGNNQAIYGQVSYNTNKGSYTTGNKGSYSSSQSDYGSQGSYGGNRPANEQSNYGETGYGSQSQRPSYNKPSYETAHGSYGGQNSYKGSYSSSYNEQINNQASYGSYASSETNRPPYDHDQDGYGQSGYQKPQKPSNSYDKPYGGNQDPYGSNQGGYGNQDTHSSTQNSYGSNQGSHDGSELYGHGSSQGNYGAQSGYGTTQSSYGIGQDSYGSTQGSNQGYGGSQGSHGSNQGGYGFSGANHGYSTSHGYGSHGESQYADHSTYGGYNNRPSHDQRPGYGNNRPDYSNRPMYDYERPSYGSQKPDFDSQTTGYGQKPSYNDPKPGYNDPKPGYDDKPDPDYRPDVKPVYEYDIEKPSNVPAYLAKPSGEVVTSRPVVIGDYERPVYKNPGKPEKEISYKACFRRVLAGQRALRSFVRKVVPCERLEDCRRECAEEKRFHCESFNYRLDPSFRGKGLCELMTKPIEAFDLRRDFVQDKDYDFYEVDRNSLEPYCPETLRGPALLHSGFLSSKNRPVPSDDDNMRPNRLDGWRDRNDWVGGGGNKFSYDAGFKGGNRRYEDRMFVPYQIGIGRTSDDQEKWGQYGGIYGGSQYYKNRNDYHKSISHWGLTSERPSYGVKPYYSHRDEHRPFEQPKDRNVDYHSEQPKDRNFDYHSLGKHLRRYFESHSSKDSKDFDYHSLGKDHRHFDYDKDDRIFDYHGKDRDDYDHKDRNKFDYHSGKDDFDHRPLGKEHHSSGEDYYGVDKSLHRYGYGAWKRGRWNASGVSNGLDEDDLSKTHYEPADRSDESSAKDCFSRRRPGMSLSTGAIRRSLIVRNVVACETACFGEKEFKCVSYSYRYSNSRGSDNCFLSERPFHGLDLSTDSGSDVYAMPQDQGCSTGSHTPWIESECFFHVRSDTVVSGQAVKSTLTVAGLGACEAECIRAQGFFCRGFSFRFDSPTIGEELHNCILTSSPTTSLSGGEARRAGGHELYARGNYGRGCEPHAQDDKDNGECYLQYDKAAKLTPSATRGHARVKDEQACSAACTDAPFKCLSFSYNNHAPPDSDNCLLSEIRLFDLQKDVDYVHSGDDWLFAFDLFNSRCWRRVHGEEHSSEIPHPIIHTSSEEDVYSSGPSGPSEHGYSPGPPRPPSGPSGPSETHYIPSSGHPSGPEYHPHPSEPDYKPHYHPPSGPESPYPIEPSGPYKPGQSSYPSGPSFKPGYPSESSFKPGYGPPEHDHKHSFKPDSDSYKPAYRPDSDSYKPAYRPDSDSYKPAYRPDSDSYKPAYRPDSDSYKPAYRPDSDSYKPDFRPNPDTYKPGYRPDPESYKPGYRPNPESYKPDFRPDSPPLRPPEREGYKPFRPEPRPDYRPELPGPYKPGSRPSETYPGKPVESGFRPGSTGSGYKPEYGDRSGYLPDDKRPGVRPQRPGFQGEKEGGPLEVSWRHYTVSGFPCRTGTTCAQNHIVGHWACEPEGGEIGSWDYCCAPSHRCGYSEGFHKPWCYVGPKEDQWRPCSEKYYPYHQHNVPHPSSQGHREDNRPPARPWQDTPPRKPDYIPHWDQPPGPYLSPADKQYWDDLYKNGPKAYYDKYGNPLPGYSRVPTENRPRIRNRYNPSRPGPGPGPSPGPGAWVPVSHEDPAGVPGSLGAPRYWPVAYLHKDPPPNTTYFRYNETKPTTTTEKYDQTTTPPPLSRELPSEPRTDKPDDLEAKSSRDDKKINVSISDDVIPKFPIDLDNDTIVNTTTEVVPVEKEVNVSDTEIMKTENYKDVDRIDGIDDKLDDFSKSIEVLDIEDAKGDKLSDLRTLEAEERQIEAIGRLLASKRGTKLVIEKRSQKDLDTRNIAVDQDLVDFNFGNRFPTERRAERRGVIRRISKDEIERDRNIDRSLEVSETTFVRPPRVLTTTESIRKAIVNGKVFYDATLRDQKDLFSNVTRKPKNLKPEDSPAFVTNNFREQRDIYLNSTRKPKHLRQTDVSIATRNTNNQKTLSNNTRKAKSLRPIEDSLSISNTKNLREERDTIHNNTWKSKLRRQDDSATTFVNTLRGQRDLYFNSSRKAKNLHRLEDNTPSVIANNNFGKRKVLIPRNVNPVRRVRRVYRKRYNPEEVRKRLLERDRNKNNTESSRKV